MAASRTCRAVFAARSRGLTLNKTASPLTESLKVCKQVNSKENAIFRISTDGFARDFQTKSALPHGNFETFC